MSKLKKTPDNKAEYRKTKTLVCSTGHVPSDKHFKNREAIATKYGWIVSVNHSPTHGIEDVIIYALKEGYAYIEFDADAPEIPNIKSYDW